MSTDKDQNNTEKPGEDQAEIPLDPKKLAYSPTEFAALFGMKKWFAYDLLYRGEIKRLAGARRILIPAAEVKRFVSKTKRHR